MNISSSSKALFAGVSGTALQWYDFALFGYFAPIIAAAYFPNDNQFASLLSAFGVFAVCIWCIRCWLFIGTNWFTIFWLYW